VARTYKRDARGRFASGGGSSKPSRASAPSSPAKPRQRGTPPPKRRGLVPQRRAVAKAKANLRAADETTSARRRGGLKGAVTKAKNRLFSDTITRRIKAPALKVATKLRPKQRTPKPPVQPPSNNIRQLSAKLHIQRQLKLTPQQFLAQEERNAARYGNAQPATNKIIRTPVTRKGRQAKVDYLRGRIAGISGDIRDEIRDVKDSLKRIKAAGDELTRKWAMRTARDMARATGHGIVADAMRGVVRAAPERERRAARAIIRGRAKRAAAAAARGSKPAARAMEIYDRQLAPVLPKGKGKGKNVIKPGPRNTQGPQKPKRKRKPKPKG